MGRPPKNAAPAGDEGQITVAEYIRTRDSVVTGLNQLSHAVQELIRAYMIHTNNTVGGNLDLNSTLAISNPLNSISAVAPPQLTPVEPDTKQKRKKKEKKDRDPNEPKRPLTAAFLFGQNARAGVKEALEKATPEGEKLAPNAVNEEITRRWNALSDADKDAWKLLYRENMERYKEELAAFNRAKEAEDHSPVKAPSPPKSAKRRKTGKESAANVASPAPVVAAASAAATKTATTAAAAKAEPTKKLKKAAAPKETAAAAEEPKKRKGRKSKGAEAEENAVETPATEKKERKRKRKSDA